ncbi:hypothetical protein EDD11_004048 [Mortierella claussenii]|nr:hypothetical protein EDD11_004048 [Mortierella claussenii]
MHTKTSNGKALFDVWMGEESDTIQGAAKSFGERMSFEQTLLLIQSQSGGHRAILETLLRLWGLSLIEAYSTWYLTRGLISHKTALRTPQHLRDVVASVGLSGLALCDILGVDERLLFAPVAGNAGGWEKYNIGDNHGELLEMDQLEIKDFNPDRKFGASKL